jgi:hypothetical protein
MRFDQTRQVSISIANDATLHHLHYRVGHLKGEILLLKDKVPRQPIMVAAHCTFLTAAEGLMHFITYQP